MPDVTAEYWRRKLEHAKNMGPCCIGIFVQQSHCRSVINFNYFNQSQLNPNQAIQYSNKICHKTWSSCKDSRDFSHGIFLMLSCLEATWNTKFPLCFLQQY